MTALARVACAHCDGSVDLAEGALEAECPWCSARLSVRHDGGAIHAVLAESADAVAARAAAASALTSVLEHQRVLTELVDQHHKDRVLHERGRIRAVRGPVVLLVLLYWAGASLACVGLAASASGEGWVLALSVVAMLASAFYLYEQVLKAIGALFVGDPERARRAELRDLIDRQLRDHAG